MIAAIAALLLQAGVPTVGDTIWITRTFAVPAGRTVRPSDWDPPDPIELLGPARIMVRGDAAVVAYPIVVWCPGELTVSPPGILLLGGNGSVDSLPAEPVVVRVRSVLPNGPADSTIAPQPRADFVPAEARTLLPLLLLWLITAVILAPLHWWWRRRGPAATMVVSPPARSRLPLEHWADTGESRAVAAAAAARLRAVIAVRIPEAHRGLDTESLLLQVVQRRPHWPLGELGDLLRELDGLRFGPRSGAEALAVARRAEAMESRLLSEAA